MNNLDGPLFFAAFCAVILAWLGGFFIAQKYNSNVLSFMKTGTSPEDNAVQSRSEKQCQSNLSHPLLPQSLSRQNIKAIWRYRLFIIGLSLILSLIITFFYIQDAMPNAPFSFRRTSLMLLAYNWSVIPCLGLLEHWSRARIVILSFIYTSIVAVLYLLNSVEGASVVDIMISLYGQPIPPLVVILFLTGSRIRTSAPYLMLVFFILVCSSLVAYQLLDHSLRENNLSSWIIDFAMLTNSKVTFVLVGVLPWLIIFFPLRYFAQRVAGLYRDKYFSEPLYLISGIWVIILLFHAMTLSHGLGISAYYLLISWLMIPLLFYCIRLALKPCHPPPTLLLLRVFREDDGIGQLFDNVLERWRYSGNTVLIAGKDLALRTLEPDQLFSFLNGHLKDQFMASKPQLQQEISRLDLEFDPDGRFRVNEFFCFDSTWKIALDALISKTDLVLMDLRDYNSERGGCTYELNVLANTPHIQKNIILFNRKTDKNVANKSLGNKASKVIWIEDDRAKANNLERKILQALLQ